jgi:hypothetical protein
LPIANNRMLIYDDDIPPTPKGSKYFMIVTDDYTRFRWFFAIAKKSDAAAKLEEWTTWVQTQFHRIPKRIRTDCGKEWLNKALAKFATQKGIQWEPTAPYSPNQDGVAERSNRTIVARARTMLLSAPNLPNSLWAEAISTSIYLTNRSPTKALPKGKTPHELLYGSKPRYRHIKTFGCAAYALKPHAKSEGKLAPRSEKLWLVGYDATTIFRLWDPERKLVRTSRDVNFNEADLAAINRPITPPAATKSTTEQNSARKPTTRSMTRNSALQEAVGAANTPSTMDFAIIVPERDQDVEYEDWTVQTMPIEQPTAKALHTSMVNDDQPSYNKAMKGPEASLWNEGIQSEYNSLTERGVWTLVDIADVPKDVKIFHPKWVLQRKRNENNEVIRHKARLVLRGYEQVPGRDYGDTYTLTVRRKTSRLLLSLAAKYN